MTARSTIDAGRLAALARRPEDTAIWASRAVVTLLGYDRAFGMFADVKLLPDGEPETCAIGSGYVGDLFGSFAPLKIDDEVLVVFPRGDPNEGPIIVCRLYNAQLRPPTQFAAGDDAPPTDEPTAGPTLVVEPGQPIRLIGSNGTAVSIELSGQCSFEVEAKDGSTVRLASDVSTTLDAPIMKLGDNATLGIARLTDPVAAATAMAVAMNAISTAITTLGTTLAGAFPPVAAPCAAVAATIEPALAQMGVISDASKKGLSE